MKNMTRTIEVSEDEKKEIKDYDDLIGRKFFFRTVTYHCTGLVTARVGSLLRLENAAWIADSGRFMDCIKNGTLNEVEPVGTMYLNMSTIVDMFEWKHKLPEEQK